MKTNTTENTSPKMHDSLSWRLITRLFASLGGQRKWVWLAMGMVCISAAADMQIIHEVTRLIEQQPWHESRLITVIVPLALLCLANRLFGWAQWLLTVFAANQAIARLRKSLFDKLMDLSKSFFDAHKSGWLVARSTGDISIIEDFLTYALMMLGVFLTVMISASIRIININPILLIPTLIIMPAIVALTWAYKRRMSTLQRTARDQNSRLVANMAETVRGVRVVQAFSRQERNLEDFNAINMDNHDTEIRIAKLDGLFMPALDFVSILNLTVVIAAASWLITQPQPAWLQINLTTGDIMAYVLYMNAMTWPCRMIVELYSMSLRAMAAAERVFEILDMQPDIQDPASPKTLPDPIRGHIQMRNITFLYPKSETPVLQQFNLDIEAGENIALVGPTGAGKTTILSLIARFHDPQQGTISLDDIDIRQITRQQYHQQLGIVLQQGYLFSGTVLENLRFRDPHLTDHHIIQQAQALGTHETIAALSDGYHTRIHEGGESLSLGQRQVIAITRAMIANPNILLLDEPTSSLDIYTESVIQQAIPKMINNRTTIIIAHRLSTIRNANRILMIQNGHITESGTHDQLIQRNGPYAQLISQSDSLTDPA